MVYINFSFMIYIANTHCPEWQHFLAEACWSLKCCADSHYHWQWILHVVQQNWYFSVLIHEVILNVPSPLCPGNLNVVQQNWDFSVLIHEVILNVPPPSRESSALLGMKAHNMFYFFKRKDLLILDNYIKMIQLYKNQRDLCITRMHTTTTITT